MLHPSGFGNVGLSDGSFIVWFKGCDCDCRCAIYTAYIPINLSLPN